jgi:hypothetical protein
MTRALSLDHQVLGGLFDFYAVQTYRTLFAYNAHAATPYFILKNIQEKKL